MLVVSRPATNVLVVSHSRAKSLVRVLIWISVVFLFFIVLILDALLASDRPPDDSAASWRTWALFLVPLFLLPYLFDLIRAIRRGDELILDRTDGIVFKGKKSLAAFAEIRAIELRTIHGTCEEFRLSAVLANGNTIALLETEASAAVEALAHQISELLDAPLIRAA